MRLFQWVRDQAPRVRYQLGRPLELGGRGFRLRGYYPNRLARNINDEPHILAALRTILAQRRGAFIDVGVNVGQTLLKVLAIDPEREYYGFEPQGDCCFYVAEFLRTNRLRNAHVLPIALSSRNGLFPLYSDKPNDDMASLLPTHTQRPTRSQVSWCDARVGDEVLSELAVESIAAIKIDVEGFELEVLTGLSNTLRGRPPILFEVLTNYAWGTLVDDDTRKINSTRANQIHSLLTGLGYSIFRVDTGGALHPVQRFDLDARPSPEFGEGRDYLAQ